MKIFPARTFWRRSTPPNLPCTGVGQVVLEGHINHCVRDGIEHGDADKTIQNFTKAVERFANMT